MESTLEPAVRLLTPEQASSALQISRTTLRGYLSRGELKSVRLHGCLRIDSKDLAEFVTANKTRGEAANG